MGVQDPPSRARERGDEQRPSVEREPREPGHSAPEQPRQQAARHERDKGMPAWESVAAQRPRSMRSRARDAEHKLEDPTEEPGSRSPDEEDQDVVITLGHQ